MSAALPKVRNSKVLSVKGSLAGAECIKILGILVSTCFSLLLSMKISVTIQCVLLALCDCSAFGVVVSCRLLTHTSIPHGRLAIRSGLHVGL